MGSLMGVSQTCWTRGSCTSKLYQISVTPSNMCSFLAHIMCPPVLSPSLNTTPCSRSRANGASSPGSLQFSGQREKDLSGPHAVEKVTFQKWHWPKSVIWQSGMLMHQEIYITLSGGQACLGGHRNTRWVSNVMLPLSKVLLSQFLLLVANSNPKTLNAKFQKQTICDF